MSRNVYQVVESQFPQFITENPNYVKFLDFIKEYYKFSQHYDVVDQVNIDTTEFLDKFINLYAKNFPELNGLSDKQKRVVLLNIDDIYKSKGTPESFDLLFSILYNTKIELLYPAEQIFKSSAATWNRDVAIRFIVTTGVLNTFNDISATLILSNDKIVKVDISRISRVEGTSNIFEAVLDIDYKLLIDKNLTATIQTDTFTGTLVKTITSKKIVSNGKGFVVGDIYDVNIDQATGLKIKVSRVGADGKLLGFQIIQFGIGYNVDFSSNILSYFYRNDADVEVELELRDNISEIQENVLITKFDYLDNTSYFEDNTYVGEVLSNQTSSTISDGSTLATISEEIAVIDFYLGYVLEYPGYHLTNIGFPSDASYLQDGEYYQQFSYVVKSSEQYENYKQALLNTVHVAGLKSFGEYTIQSYINLMIDIENQLNFLDITLSDTASVADEMTKIYIKNMQDSATVLETISKSISKIAPIEPVSVSDFAIKQIQKGISDKVTLTELFLKNYQKSISDFATISDINIKTVTKNATDSIAISEMACAFTNDSYYDISEGLYWECGYTDTEILISG